MIRRATSLLLLLGACAAPPGPAPEEPGRISVEMYQGLGGKAAGSFLPAIELIVDATRSMQASAVGAASRLEAAQAKAAELLASLPPGSLAGLNVVGASPAAECAPVERRTPLRAATDPALAQALRDLSSSSEASLADAVKAIGTELRLEGRARDARVVLITDLEESCGGDLCAAAGDLLAAGAWLDVVVLGDAPAPACLSGLRPSAEQPGALVRALTRPAPAWHLVPVGAAPDSRAPTGRAGRQPLDAPPGDWFVSLELERPLAIGPVPVVPGRLTRVRVLHFSGGSPRFAWEIVDERR